MQTYATELELQAFFDLSPDLFCISEPFGRLKKFNQAWHGLLGWTEAELIQKTWIDLVHPDDVAATLKAHNRGNGVARIESRLRHRNGDFRWLCWSLQRFGDNSIYSIGRDITDRKCFEAQLQEREARHRAMIEAIPDLIIRMDREGTYLDFHPPKDFKILRNSGDMRGTSIFDILPPSVAQERMRYIRQALETGQMQIYDYSLEIDGDLKHQEARIAVSGENEVIVIVRDVTERHQADEQLRQSEARHRAIVEDQTDLVTRFQPDLAVTFVNEAYCRYFGVERDELIGKPFEFLIYPEDRDRVIEHIRSLTPEHPVKSIERRTVIKGEVRWLHWTDRAFFDDQGNFIENQAVGQDITDRKRAEFALQQLNRELENKVQERTAALVDTVQQLQQEIVERQIAEHQNALLATAVEYAADSIEITDAHYQVQYVNSAFESISGYSRSEAIGKTPAELFRINEIVPNFSEAIESAIEAGQVWRGSMVAHRKDGSCSHLEATISPVIDANGAITHFVALKRDITERKRIEEQLQLAQFSIDHAADMAFWIGQQGIFVYTNQAACHKLGYSAEELRKMTVSDIDPSFPMDLWVEHWQELKERKSFTFETQHRAKSGHTYPVEVTVNFLEFNGTEYNFAFARDITDRRQAEEEVQRALEREKELNKLKSDFVSMVSHEFRTPLSIILASAESLKHYGHRWSEDKHLLRYDRIISSVSRMTQMLDDVLIFNRGDAGRLIFEPISLNLDTFCYELIEEIHLSASKHKLNFECKGTGELVQIDPQLLRHILSNLLSNATKYSPEGSIISLDVRYDLQEAIFQIHDQGIGIPQDDLDKLFNSFHRCKNVGNISGNGLGLAIVKQCVERHHGTIDVTSQVGEGTLFTVTLPVDRVR